MKRGVSPAAVRRTQLENVAISIHPVAESRAVEITGRVHSQAGIRASASSKAVKGVKCPAAVSRRQFEDRATLAGAIPLVAAGSAAIVGRTVEVAGLIEDYAGIGVCSVGSSREGVKDVLRPPAIYGRQLVNDTAAAMVAVRQQAADDSRAVEVTRSIKDEVTVRGTISVTASVGASREPVEHGLLPRAECGFASRRVRCQHENRSAANAAEVGASSSPSLESRPVETAVGADDHSSFGVIPVIAALKTVERAEYPAGTFVRQLENG